MIYRLFSGTFSKGVPFENIGEVGVKMSLILTIKNKLHIETDYKGREMSEKYISITIALKESIEIIITNHKLIDAEGKELKYHEYHFTGPAPAKSKRLTFKYKLPDDNYILNDGSKFILTYKFINKKKEITESFLLSNEDWKRDICEEE